MVDLDGKNVLLIMPNFFGYEKEIVRSLERRGARVTFVGDRPSLTSLAKVITRIHPLLIKRTADRYFREHLFNFPSDTFDFVLVIKGEAMSPAITKQIFNRFSRAKKIFYLWDSFKNSKGALSKIQLFDSVLTFDPLDAKKYPNVKFRPLFFVDSYLRKITDVPAGDGIDLLFVGTAHTDRYKVLSKIVAATPGAMRQHIYLYLASKHLYWLRRFMDPRFKGARFDQFSFVPIPPEVNASLFRRARTIIDVERQVQRGLTIRTLEVLAAGKKLITTNSEITTYDFFRPNNILVIDRSQPHIPAEFLESPFTPVEPAILRKYCLDAWIDDVFG